jgi:hypothetical protein
VVPVINHNPARRQRFFYVYLIFYVYYIWAVAEDSILNINDQNQK